jgi:hypothetical protein
MPPKTHSSYSFYSYVEFNGKKKKETKFEVTSKNGKHIEGIYQHKDDDHKTKTIKINDKNIKTVVKLLENLKK